MNPYTIALSLMLLVSALTDLVRRFSFGSISALGVLTIVAGVGSFVLVILRAKIPKAAMAATSLVLFLVLGVFSLYLNSATAVISVVGGMQNLLTYGAFVGLLILSAIETSRSPYLPWYVSDGFTRIAQISGTIYGVSLLIDGFGTSLLMGARSFALFAIIAVAWCLAMWRYRSPGAAVWALLLSVLVAASFSRTAMIATLVLYPLSRFSPHKAEGWLKMMVWVGMMTLIAYLAFTFVEPIRERFTDTGDSGQLGGLRVNTSGRETIWEAVQASIDDSPLIGKGPGSVAVPVNAVNKTANGHPHNDYLRLMHDYGYIGLGLWLCGYGSLLVATLRNWLWADRYDRSTAHIHLAALLALVGVALAMLIDNLVIYIFAMAPLGVLVGASIGVGSLRRKMLAEQRQEAYLQSQEEWLEEVIL
jgi:O-antigen ligase